MMPGHKQIQKEIASLAFPQFSPLLISTWMLFWFVNVFTKYFNFATLSENLLPIFMLWFCPSFSSWDMNMYRTWFSEHLLMCKSFLVTNVFLLFYLMQYVLSPDKLTLSAESRSWCAPFIFSLSRFACTFLMAYIKAVAIYHLLLPIILSKKCYVCIFWRHYVALDRIFINLTSFMVIANLVKIL